LMAIARARRLAIYSLRNNGLCALPELNSGLKPAPFYPYVVTSIQSAANHPTSTEIQQLVS
ncbi:MAG: hypothetical protein REJ50_22465, partial [Bordetella sp.]|nr:hypothetical protein [Bordetella sp.]